MATTAFIDLTTLNVSTLTNGMSINVTATDLSGQTITICSMVGNFAGFTKSQFITAVVNCIIASGLGFTAVNQNPKIKVTTTLANYVLAGSALVLTFPPYFTEIGNQNLAASSIRGLCAVNNVVSPLNGFVFAVAYDTNQLFKISSGVVVQTVDLGIGFNPNDVEYNPTNDCLYIASIGHGYVRKLNNTLATVSNIVTGVVPVFVKYNSFNQCIYSCNQGADTLSKITVADAVTSITTAFTGVAGCTECRVNTYNGDVWVMSNITPEIKVFDATTNALVNSFSTPDIILGIEFYPGTNSATALILLSQPALGFILAYDVFGNLVDTLRPFTTPARLWYISQIDKLVITSAAGNLTFYDLTTQAIINLFTTSSQQSEAVYEADANYVYVATNQTGQSNLYWYGYISEGLSFTGIFLEEARTDGNCSFCLPLEIYECYGSYIIDIGLEPNTKYNLLFTSIHNRKYNLQVTTDANGVFLINPDLFPEGFFTPEMSPIGLEIFDINNIPVGIVSGYTLYTCLSLTVIQFTELTEGLPEFDDDDI